MTLAIFVLHVGIVINCIFPCDHLFNFYFNFGSSFIAVIFVVLEEDFFCDADEGDLSEQGQVP